MPMSRRLRFVLSVLASLALPVAGAGAGSISGTVTDADTRAGLAGICVNATSDGAGFVAVETDPDGTYVLGDLPAGAYEVFATDCTDPVEYSPVDFRNIRGLNRNRATFVKLKTADKAKKNVDFKMPRAGHILVHLRTSDDLPISGVLVCPFWFERDRKKNGNVFQSGLCASTAVGTGDVVLDVTAGGSKILAFTGGGVYYDGPDARTDDFDAADVVTVGPDGLVEITFKPNPTP